MRLAIETYMCANGVGATVNNSSVPQGEGTDMEHHWDEGFGCVGESSSSNDKRE